MLPPAPRSSSAQSSSWLCLPGLCSGGESASSKLFVSGLVSVVLGCHQPFLSLALRQFLESRFKLLRRHSVLLRSFGEIARRTILQDLFRLLGDAGTWRLEIFQA